MSFQRRIDLLETEHQENYGNFKSECFERVKLHKFRLTEECEGL